jgi:glycosyltransferase involved in cell wall biosynthesis
MKISIITPCYNSEEFINKTIESVIKQEGNFEIEYIIVDGKSSDKTLEIINYYKSNLENNAMQIKCNSIEIKLISEPDKGMYDALSKGLKIVSGDIIGYINSDDIYLDNALKCIVKVMENPKINWITAMNNTLNEEGIMIGSFLPFRYKSHYISMGIYGTTLPFIQQESTFWKKTMLNYINVDQLRSYKYAGDYYLWHCFSKYDKLYVVKALLAAFRNRKNQLSQNKEMYYKEFNEIKDKRNVIMLPIFIERLLWILPNRLKIKYSKNTITIDN